MEPLRNTTLLTDAINGTNEIPTPAAYIAPNGVAYIKVFNGNNVMQSQKLLLQ
jgi:hypothetical protein